jgi:hypothetical protein
MTLQPFQGSLFADGLTSSPEGFPANHSQPQESERDETMNDISFRQCWTLFGMSDRHGASLRTFAGFLISNLEKYSPRLSHHWKGKATRSSRFVFQLAPSKPRTKDSDCGSSVTLATPQARDYRSPDSPDSGNFKRKIEKGWTIDLNSQIAMLPSPVASDAGAGAVIGKDDVFKETSGLPRKVNRNGKDGSIGLARLVQFLPTPTTNDVSGGANKVKIEGGQFKRDAGTIEHSANLQSVIAMLPTPQAGFDGERAGRKAMSDPKYFEKRRLKGKQTSLTEAIVMLPTPISSDNRDRGSWQDGAIQRRVEKGKSIELSMMMNQKPDGENPGLKLQPAFVEWMLGYPNGWTDLNHSETASSRK